MKVSLTSISTVTALLLIAACSLAVNDDTTYYTVNTTDGKAYYHLMYSLKAENIVSMDRLTQDEFYQNGGQFEVHIDKGAFPIRSPNCRSNIILRMPWVKDNGSLDTKYNLYKNLTALNDGEFNSNNVDVAIELNPYLSSDDEGIYLTQCNVFFRSKDGQYVDNIHQ